MRISQRLGDESVDNKDVALQLTELSLRKTTVPVPSQAQEQSPDVHSTALAEDTKHDVESEPESQRTKLLGLTDPEQEHDVADGGSVGDAVGSGGGGIEGDCVGD